MSSLARRFIKDGSVYSLQPFIAKAISIFLVPLYTAYLTTKQYGEFSFIFALGMFLIPIIDLGQVSSFWKFNSEAEGTTQLTILSTAILMRLYSGIGIALIFLGLAGIFEGISFIFSAYIFSYAFFQAFNLVQCRMRAEHRARSYLLSAVAYSIMLVGLNILFVARLRMNASGVVLSTISAFGLCGILALFTVWRSNRLSFDRVLAWKMLRYGAPLAIGNLAGVLLGVTDKFMIKGFLGDSALGLYSFGFKFGMMFQGFVVTTFFLAWNPVRWEIYRISDGVSIFQRISKVIYFIFPGLALLSAGALVLMADLLAQDASYSAGIVVIPVVAIGYCFYGLYYFDVMGILFSGKTKVITWIVITGSLLNIFLNYFLISAFEILGAAFATTLSYFVMRIIGHKLSNRYYPVMTGPLSQYVPSILSTVIVLLSVPIIRNGELVECAAMLAAAGVMLITAGWLVNRAQVSLLIKTLMKKA